MATSGRIETASPAGKNSRFYLQWQMVSQNVTNNTTTINWQAGLYVYNDYWYTNAMRIDSGSINGVAIPPITRSNITTNGDHEFRSGTITIAHSADGTKSFNADINGWLYSYGNRTQSGSWSLPTIPRATQPSLPGSFDVGTNVTISLPRASGSFTHRVEYSFNGQSGVIATAAGTSVVWSVPTSLANTRPNNTSGTGTITAKTYSGSTLIGTKTAGFTANIPNTSAFKPTTTNIVVSEDNPDVSSKFSVYVQGKSIIKTTFDAAGAYGSTIVSKSAILVVLDTGEVFTYDTPTPIPLSGDFMVYSVTKDSRNRATSNFGADVYVYPYTNPAVSTLSAIRTNSSGVADDNGTYAKVTMVGSITALDDENDKTYTLKYKKLADATWTSVNVTPAVGYDLNGTHLLSGIDVDSAYDIKLEATDYFTTTTVSTNVPTAFTIMDFHKDGNGMAFGKVASQPNRWEVGPKLPVHIIAPSSTAEDAGFIRLRRSDDSLLSFISTGPGGTGLKFNMYDGTTWKGALPISETGMIPSQNVDFTTLGWTSYTPTVTGFSGTPTVNARYLALGKIVFISVVIGGTSNSSTLTVTYPVPAIYAGDTQIGQALTGDTTNYFGAVNNKSSGSSAYMQVYRGSSSPYTAWLTTGPKNISMSFFYIAN